MVCQRRCALTGWAAKHGPTRGKPAHADARPHLGLSSVLGYLPVPAATTISSVGVSRPTQTDVGRAVWSITFLSCAAAKTSCKSHTGASGFAARDSLLRVRYRRHTKKGMQHWGLAPIIEASHQARVTACGNAARSRDTTTRATRSCGKRPR